MNIDDVFELVLNPPRGLPLPPVAGARIRIRCEDFEVEELPAYFPEGAGEHLFLWIEKRNTSSPDLIRHLSKTLSLNERDIGLAGQKDKAAVTRQFVSVPLSARDELPEIDTDRIRVLLVAAHRNKLRTGHLHGNQFQITAHPVRNDAFSEEQLTDVRTRLCDAADRGFPNYFGPQRFGRQGRNLRKDRRLQHAASAAARPSSKAARFNVSVWQAAVFNLVLADRVRQQNFRQPVEGDVVCRRGGIRPFLFADRGTMPVEELVPMGPLPGPKTMAASGPVADLEQAALEHLGLSMDLFKAQGRRAPGVRRPMLEFPRNVSATPTAEGGIQLQFELSAGSFATVLLAELFAPLIDASQPSSSSSNV